MDKISVKGPIQSFTQEEINKGAGLFFLVFRCSSSLNRLLYLTLKIAGKILVVLFDLTQSFLVDGQLSGSKCLL